MQFTWIISLFNDFGVTSLETNLNRVFVA